MNYPILRNEAIQLDKTSGFYADLDNDSGAYCVFGLESGFAYASYADESEAEERADEMNARYESP